jgi:hypothetical protein
MSPLKPRRLKPYKNTVQTSLMGHVHIGNTRMENLKKWRKHGITLIATAVTLGAVYACVYV